MTPRIDNLRQRLHDAAAGRMCTTIDDQRAFARIALDTCRETVGHPAVARRVALLRNFADRFPLAIADDELILGSQKFGFHWNWINQLDDDDRAAIDLAPNHGHIVVDYARVLRLGTAGLQQQILDAPRSANSDAFLAVVEAFATFIRRHGQLARTSADATTDPLRADELRAIADNCDHLVVAAPTTFWQALQLLWFTQIFLHAESGNAAISFGRFDQYLWPFLDRDLRAGTLTLDNARELLACFWIKTCEGDESQNLTLGGIDADGRCVENPLSMLCLNLARELHVCQPSLSVRIGEHTSDDLWRETLLLAAEGLGQPSIFNDDVVIAALQAVDIPLERARDWAIVGCYEATTQGDCCGMTVAMQWNLADTLNAFLAANRNEATFDALVAALKFAFADAYNAKLSDYRNYRERAEFDSPFQAVCLTGCIESGRTAERAGARFNLAGINMLGIGTVIDSLHAINELVYKTQSLTLSALQRQLANNFTDVALQTRCRNLANRFGTDSDFTNRLAHDLSTYLADTVLASRVELADGTVRPDPAFFAFSGDIYAQTSATPDGRRAGEYLSYGCGPVAFSRSLSAVSILNSAAHIAHTKCACGNPLTLSLNRDDVSGETGLNRLQQLIRGYFRQGGFHLHFNIVDAQQLRDAQQHDDISELMIRISGFSANFKTLDKRWQDALIERTEKGL